MSIKQAIEALERGMESTGTGTLHYQCMKEALAALRSLQPATEEEMREALGAYYSGNTVMAFRAAERFHGIGK